MKETKKESPRLKDICVVHEYPYVFPNELPSLSPKREVEFTIELILNTELIFITPYRNGSR